MDKTDSSSPEFNSVDEKIAAILAGTYKMPIRHSTLELEIKKDLESNPRFQKFFEGHSDSSVDHFINHYAFVKRMYVGHADTYESQLADAAMEFRSQAEGGLWDIARKKVFDLECLWQANQIKIEGIDHSFQFQKFWHDPLNCPHTDPITEEEVEMYIEFLKQREQWHHEYNDNISWEELRHELKYEPEHADSWFLYHSKHTESGNLLVLPATRLEQEKEYIGLAYEEARNELERKKKKQAAENAKQEGANPPRPTRLPRLETSPEIIAQFVAEFENKALNRLYRNYAEVERMQNAAEDRNGYLSDELDTIMFKIKEIDEDVPIAAHSDWRMAICLAYYGYINRKIAAAMPSAYSDYQFKSDTGISHPKGEIADWQLEHIEMMGEKILRGRELSGEPRTFDF